jgi:enolase
MKIEKIHAREILDSRGNPTVEVEVTLENGVMGRASVPSGASTGENEALELRETATSSRFGGKGVLKAVGNVNDKVIAPALEWRRGAQSAGLSMRRCLTLDGTPTKSRSRCQCHPRRQSRHSRSCGGTRARHVPLYRYIGGMRHLRAACADDEHHQWRRSL